ncbi:MAG: cytidine deaminase [Alphaproteobacteria bacterium]|nr:cytidine deaminase [Alphaproteobacteria bacterium]
MTPGALIQKARKLIQKRYEHGGHHAVVAAAVLTKSGKVYTALNVGTYQPSISTCAEIIAIGMAHAAEPGMEIEMLAAVRDANGYVIAPCGKCREYIADYGPDARVIIPADNKQGYAVMPIAELLPHKYVKRT